MDTLLQCLFISMPHKYPLLFLPSTNTLVYPSLCCRSTLLFLYLPLLLSKHGHELCMELCGQCKAQSVTAPLAPYLQTICGSGFAAVSMTMYCE